MKESEMMSGYKEYCDNMIAKGKPMVSFASWKQRVLAGYKIVPDKAHYTMVCITRDNRDAILKMCGKKSFNKCCDLIIEKGIKE